MIKTANSHFHTLPDPFVASFERSLRADGKRPRTIEHYVSSTEIFLLWAEGEGLDTLTVRKGDIQSWVVSMQDRGWATSSVNNRFRGLRSFYDWLLAEEEISASPFGPPKARTLTAPEIEPTEKDVVPQDIILKVLTTLEKQKRWRDCAVIAALYDTGMRREELAGLLVEHLDMDTGYATLTAANTKGKRTRVVRFSPKVLRYIDRHWRSVGRKGRADPRYVLNGTRGRMTGSGVYQVVREAFAELGLEAKIGPHDLRHTSASHVAEDGEMSESSMMELYGWKSAEMVRHYSAQARQRAALKAHVKYSPLERLGR